MTAIGAAAAEGTGVVRGGAVAGLLAVLGLMSGV